MMIKRPSVRNIGLTRHFRKFFESERTGGLLLIGCTILSILVTNSSVGETYLHFWHHPAGFSTGPINVDLTVEQWINDGLMAIFFLMVGLEIEREIYIGELADMRKALLPMLAAVGGMVLPATLHFAFNHGTAEQAGVGIPMATDIAFALGILSLCGNRVPAAAKIFLTALAIIDDLGAIIVIAIFYTKTISFLYLGAALGVFILLLIFNRLNIRNIWFYLLPGIFMWYCFLHSGIHATLSGVLLAFAIPFRKGGVNPSEKLLLFLHKPVAFGIMPIFALANTGIDLSGHWAISLLSPNSLGIMVGLVVGKPLGILLACWAGVKSRLCRLPEGVNWKLVTGLGILGGIGFTMSVFITNLAFDGEDLMVQQSKIAVFTASLLAGLLGLLVIRVILKNKQFSSSDQGIK